jgi:hypothetical protein
MQQLAVCKTTSHAIVLVAANGTFQIGRAKKYWSEHTNRRRHRWRNTTCQPFTVCLIIQ